MRSSDKEIKKAKTSEIIIGVCHHKKSAVTKLMTSADVIGRTQIDLSQFPFGEAEDDLSKPRVFPIFSRATENQVGDITVSIQRSKKALRVPNLLARRGTFSKPPCEQMRFNESHQNTLAMENAPVDPFAPQKRADGVVSELMIAADRGTEMDLEIVADLLKLVAEEAEIPYNFTEIPLFLHHYSIFFHGNQAQSFHCSHRKLNNSSAISILSRDLLHLDWLVGLKRLQQKWIDGYLDKWPSPWDFSR